MPSYWEYNPIIVRWFVYLFIFYPVAYIPSEIFIVLYHGGFLPIYLFVYLFLFLDYGNSLSTYLFFCFLNYLFLLNLTTISSNPVTQWHILTIYFLFYVIYLFFPVYLFIFLFLLFGRRALFLVFLLFSSLPQLTKVSHRSAVATPWANQPDPECEDRRAIRGDVVEALQNNTVH